MINKIDYTQYVEEYHYLDYTTGSNYFESYKIKDNVNIADISDEILHDLLSNIPNITTKDFARAVLKHESTSDEEIVRKYAILDFFKGIDLSIASMVFTSENMVFEEADYLLSSGFRPKDVVSSLLDGHLTSLNNVSADHIANKVTSIVRKYSLTKSDFDFSDENEYQYFKYFINTDFSKEFLKFLSDNIIDIKELINFYFDGIIPNQDLSVEKQLSDLSYLFDHNPNLKKIALDMWPGTLMTLNKNVFSFLMQDISTPHEFLYNSVTKDYHILNGYNSNVVSKFIETYFNDISIINQKYPDGRSVLELLMDYNCDTKMINTVISLGADPKIDIKTYLDNLFNNLVFSNIIDRVNAFDNFTQYEVTQHLRADGMSHNDVSLLTNVINITKEFIKYNDRKESNLSDKEFKIINPNYTEFNASDFDTNESSFHSLTQLHLLLLAGKYRVVLKVLKDNPSIVNDFTSLRIISLQKNIGYGYDYSELEKELITNSDNIDIISDNGESLFDDLINDPSYKDVILSKTKDSLYQLLKSGTDLKTIVLDQSKTHIAISHGDSYWSGGIFSFARLVMKKFADVEFHIVNMGILDKGGNNLIKQMDGWINPGAGDSYPKNMKMFDKSNWNKTLDTEKIYQHALDLTHKFHIPYLGMCAGAQNLVLNHNGYLQPLSGYTQGQHEISLIEGTLTHFQSMTKVQQQSALKTCIFPSIKFKGDTAHHFAAVTDKLGDGIKLGGVSEDDVAMSYNHVNGLRFGAQFHPEHMYNVKGDSNHQKVFLNNFVELAVIHHDAREGGTHPAQYMQDVSDKLHQCFDLQICAVENIESLFDL